MTICADEGPTRDSNTKKNSIAASSKGLRPAIPKELHEVTMAWWREGFERLYFLPEDR